MVVPKLIRRNSMSPKPKNYWTEEKCRSTASEFKTRQQYREKHPGAYKSAKLNGWLDSIFPDTPKANKWSKSACDKASKPYSSRSEFKYNNRSAYEAALRHGWLDEFIPATLHTIKKGHWCSKENCYDESLKYASRSEFKNGNAGAYQSAWHNMWLEEFFPKPENTKE
jgi:hypothetical protein